MTTMAKRRKKRIARTISLADLMAQYPTEEDALRYLERLRWGDAPTCAKCGGRKKLAEQEKAGDYWCGDCRGYFSVRTGTPFERSKVDLRKWMLAGYLLLTSRKGIPSLQMSKELGVTQKTAWFMLHRLRAACSPAAAEKLGGEVEVDEIYIGGKERNKHESKKLRAGRGAVGKQTVLGMRERGGRSVAMPVPDTAKDTLLPEISDRMESGSVLYTDEHSGYDGVEDAGYRREAVCHSAKQFVDGMASTNSVESMWASVKRGFYGTYHSWSRKHCWRYVDEFSFRLRKGSCEHDTADRMDSLFSSMLSKEPVLFRELTADRP